MQVRLMLRSPAVTQVGGLSLRSKPSLLLVQRSAKGPALQTNREPGASVEADLEVCGTSDTGTTTVCPVGA
jgi:hypothetical protein